MRIGGYNWLAVLSAALAIYAIGFIIYGVLIEPVAWMAMAGVSQAEMDAVGASRMPFGALMPLMTAIFMAVLFKMGRVEDTTTGIRWAIVIALASAVPALGYGWVYGVGAASMTLLDSAHLLLGHVAAGAILGGWR